MELCWRTRGNRRRPTRSSPRTSATLCSTRKPSSWSASSAARRRCTSWSAPSWWRTALRRHGTRAHATPNLEVMSGDAGWPPRKPPRRSPRVCRWNTCRAWTTSTRWWPPRTTPRAASPPGRSCSPRTWRAWWNTWPGTPTARWPSSSLIPREGTKRRTRRRISCRSRAPPSHRRRDKSRGLLRRRFLRPRPRRDRPPFSPPPATRRARSWRGSSEARVSPRR
mmetsp:Transcript_2300/g.9035  ORF Transcript_2300/g.9035 Transcript_2300/m.9035 type:complete len:223 (+) Transcript_2300:522-1190(+)